MFGTCVRCQASVDTTDSVLCYTCSNQTTEKAPRDLFYVVAGGITILILAMFFQIRTWDKYALEIIPIQMKALVGTLDAEDLDARATICLDRHYYDCTEQDYSALIQLKHDPQDLLRLGKLEMGWGHYGQAIQTYQTYFTAGGKDMDARYRYAQALSQTGNAQEAARNYEQVIDSKPGTVQVTVLKKYVKTLIAANDSARAVKVIKDVRRKSDSQTKFMDEEYMAYQGHGAATGSRMPASL